jgi:sugar/nucleoside kinase (ribokinase family)
MVRVVGIGLVALDIVVDERTQERVGAWAGGSCGNVLAILSWLGWESAAVGRIADDRSGITVREDLQRVGVSTRWLTLGTPAPTPVFIQRLTEGPDGSVRHRFERFCPNCGGRLPGYQAVTRSALGPVLADLDNWDVVYIDRPSAAAVTLASEARERGKLVFFEPSSRGTERHMWAIASAAHIVKYSHDRLLPADREAIEAASPLIEIETMGGQGLRYRIMSEWRHLTPVSVKTEDTAGAGDWTTAGILHGLCHRGTREAKRNALDAVLASAQALGAWSCRFRAPRGAMDEHTPQEALAGARALLRGTSHGRSRRQPIPVDSSAQWACTSCD